MLSSIVGWVKVRLIMRIRCVHRMHSENEVTLTVNLDCNRSSDLYRTEIIDVVVSYAPRLHRQRIGLLLACSLAYIRELLTKNGEILFFWLPRAMVLCF